MYTKMIRTQVEMVTIPVKLDAAARVGSFQLIMLDLLLNHFQDLYDRIEEASKQKFEALLNEEGGVTVMQYNPMIRRLYLIGMFQVPTNVLGMLTRLRQVALHTGLVPSNYLEELQSSITNDSLDKPGALIKINPKLKVKLQAILAQAIEDSQVSGGVSVCRRYLICQTGMSYMLLYFGGSQNYWLCSHVLPGLVSFPTSSNVVTNLKNPQYSRSYSTKSKMSYGK